MSRTFRRLFFFAAATTLAISAASAASVPVTEAATPVAKPLPGCSAVLSTAVAAADLKKAASRASSSGSGSTDGSSGGSGSTNGSSGGSGSTNGSSSGSGSSNGSSSGSGSSSARSAPYSKTLLANGDFLLETSWQTWECMNGVKARAFLTLRPFPASSSAAARKSDDGGGGGGGGSNRGDDGVLHCSTIDAGIEIDDQAFQEDTLPSVAQVDACRPRFCVASSKGNNTTAGAGAGRRTCEGPYLRTYLDSPASDSAFAPFRAVQLDYEPLGHAPRGIYADPHFDFHFYYDSPREEVEAIERGECGGGFLSAASWKRALAPVPLKCFPSGAAWTNVGLAVYGMGNHIVNLLSPEFGRLPMRGFGTTLLFASALFLGRRGGGGRSSFFLLLLLPVRAAALFSPRSSVFSFSLSFSFE